MSVTSSGISELHWWTDEWNTVRYTLYRRLDNGQLVLVDTMDQGPFDTAVEVGQWAVKALSRMVPPSAC